MVDSNGRPTNPIWIKILTDNTENIPSYQTPGSAACDLKSTGNYVIPPGSRVVIDTGIKLEIPKGFAAQVCPRSGLAAKNGITVLNSPGIIDNDYRGEIKVILHNSGMEEFIVKKGDRIAQLLFFPIFQAIFQRTEEVSTTNRGEGGFGSTGV